MTFSYSTYIPIYEKSAAYAEFESALSAARDKIIAAKNEAHTDWIKSILQPPPPSSSGGSYGINFTALKSEFGSPYGGTEFMIDSLENITPKVDFPKTSTSAKVKNTINTDNWEIEISMSYLPSEPFYPSYSGNYKVSSSASSVENMIDGSMNDWYAGGKLYDAPRGGNMFFHPTGDLNTLRFLGLDDKNYNAALDKKLYGLANVHRILGVTAGASSSDINGLASLAKARAAQGSLYQELVGDGAIVAEEYEHGNTNIFVPDYQTTTADCDNLPQGCSAEQIISDYLGDQLGEDLANLNQTVNDTVPMPDVINDTGTTINDAITTIFSDRRLKKNLIKVGMENGFTIYTWDWVDGFDGGYNKGVIAQEVLEIMPEAVVMQENGYYMVNYKMIGIEIQHNNSKI